MINDGFRVVPVHPGLVTSDYGVDGLYSPACPVSPGCTGANRNSSFSLQWKSDESTKHYLTQMLVVTNRRYDRWEKFTYAYEGPRSPTFLTDLYIDLGSILFVGTSLLIIHHTLLWQNNSSPPRLFFLYQAVLWIKINGERKHDSPRHNLTRCCLPYFLIKELHVSNL